MHDANSNQLDNHFLIASSGLDDPLFSQSVTLICKHNELGSFGIIINQPITLSIAEVLNKLAIIDQFPTHLIDTLSLNGGPIQPEQGFVIHDNSKKQWKKTLTISDTLSVTMSSDILSDIAKGEGPEHYQLALGCSIWDAGQLEEEIKENAWLTCPSSNQIIFNTPHEERWVASSQLLGFDISLMPTVAGHA